MLRNGVAPRAGFATERRVLVLFVSLISSGVAMLVLGGTSSRYAIGLVMLVIGAGFGSIGIHKSNN